MMERHSLKLFSTLLEGRMEIDGVLCNYESIMFYPSKIEGRTAYDRFYRRRESDDQCQADVTQLRGGKTTLMFGGASSN